MFTQRYQTAYQKDVSTEFGVVRMLRAILRRDKGNMLATLIDANDVCYGQDIVRNIKKNLDRAVIRLDNSKAFDRVRWDFIHSAIDRAISLATDDGGRVCEK